MLFFSGLTRILRRSWTWKISKKLVIFSLVTTIGDSGGRPGGRAGGEAQLQITIVSKSEMVFQQFFIAGRDLEKFHEKNISKSEMVFF